MNNRFSEIAQKIEKDLWDYLKNTSKKIILYGMGDGAEKICKALSLIGKQPDDFMASDAFVRGHEFMGKRVKTLSEIKSLYSNFVILVSFGTNIKEVIEYIFTLSEAYEVYLPHVPVFGEGLFDYNYFIENKKRFEELYSILADKESKIALENLVYYRLTGKVQYIKNIMHNREQSLSLLNLGDNEVYVDLGAYNGDTINEFLNITQARFSKIIALEPDTKNYAKMRRRFYMLNPKVFNAYNAGVWDKTTEIPFSGKRGRGSRAGQGKMVKVYCIDDLLKHENPTYIKYDIEGCENEGLKGSENTIALHKPKLCISAYHKIEDLLELPLFINGIRRDYKIYLRHDECLPDWDSCYYFV